LVNDTRRRLRRYFAAGTPQPSTTVAASANDVFRKNAAVPTTITARNAATVNDSCRKKCVKSHRFLNGNHV
jgi:hypothetical protein